MRRRDVVAVLGVTLAWPRFVCAQNFEQRPLIGYLETGRAEAVQERDAAFLAGMREFGYVEGQDFNIVYRFADEDYGRLPALAEELVQGKPRVIVTANTTAALAAAKATRTVPIVSAIINDVRHADVIASYARPGGNVTGVMNTIEGLPGKLVEITLEAVPHVSRIGILINPANLSTPAQQGEIETIAKAKGLKIVQGEVRIASDLPRALKAFSDTGVDAVIVSRDTILLSAAARVAELALAARLPTIAGQSEEVRAGELISYGASITAVTRRAAYFVDRILRGAKPADLPVEFPTKIELAINMKTAKALGLAIPQSLLIRADEVIE